MNKVKYFSPNQETDPNFTKKFINFIKIWWKIKFVDVNFSFNKEKKQALIELAENKNIEILL